MRRRDVWWANLPNPVGSRPGYRRPVLVLSSNEFSEILIATVVCAAITSNRRLADAPGNVRLKRRDSGLSRDSDVNVSQIITLDKGLLTARAKVLPVKVMQSVETGLRLVLAV